MGTRWIQVAIDRRALSRESSQELVVTGVGVNQQRRASRRDLLCERRGYVARVRTAPPLRGKLDPGCEPRLHVSAYANINLAHANRLLRSRRSDHRRLAAEALPRIPHCRHTGREDLAPASGVRQLRAGADLASHRSCRWFVQHHESLCRASGLSR